MTAQPQDPHAATAALLFAGSSEEVLARLLAGDPLDLRARLCAALARERLLLDVERALLRLQSLVALHARELHGPGALEAFLEASLRETVRGLVHEHEEEAGPFGEPLEFCCQPLGLDAHVLGEACRGFNRLPPEVREAFEAAVLAGEPPERSARARKLSLTEFARRARAGLEPFRRPRRARGVPA